MVKGRRVCLSSTLQPPSLFFPFYRPVVATTPPLAIEYSNDAQALDALGVLSLVAVSQIGVVGPQVLINDDPHEVL